MYEILVSKTIQTTVPDGDKPLTLKPGKDPLRVRWVNYNEDGTITFHVQDNGAWASIPKEHAEFLTIRPASVRYRATDARTKTTICVVVPEKIVAFAVGGHLSKDAVVPRQPAAGIEPDWEIRHTPPEKAGYYFRFVGDKALRYVPLLEGPKIQITVEKVLHFEEY